MKKLVSILLTLAMVFSLASVSAFAATPVKGSITIKNLKTETVYDVYKMFEASVATSGSTESYSYKIKSTDPWYGFVSTVADSNGTKYFVLTEIADDGTAVTYSVARAAAFQEKEESMAVDVAKKGIEHARANSEITAVRYTYTPTGSDNGVYVINDLDLGYYLLDTSVGSLCALTTTKPNAEIEVKNQPPKISVLVQEDSMSDSGTASWLEDNTADLGQLVRFDVTIDAQKGALNYVMHSDLENMEYYKPAQPADDAAQTEKAHYNDYKLTVYLNKIENVVDPSNYTVVENAAAGCSLEIRFNEDFCSTLTSSDKVYVRYSATLKENAVIGGEGNKNTVKLSYGEIYNGEPIHETATDFTTTYTYGMDIVKTDNHNAKLEGAEFVIYKMEESTPVYLTFTENNGTYTIDHDVTATDINQATKIVVNANSSDYAKGFTVARINGIDNDTYYIKETKEPAGYNILLEAKLVQIDDATNYAEIGLDAQNKPTYGPSNGGVHIINSAGNYLPETGGMGTMLFVTFGTIVVIGAGVLLVTKKRMSMIEE